MNKNVATEINKIIVDGYAMLHASIDSVRHASSREESNAYCLIIGRVLGYMLLDLMDPLHKEHADLMPHYLAESADETVGEQEMELDPSNIFLSLHPGAESTRHQTRLITLLEDLTTALKTTVALVRDHCQESEAVVYQRRVAEVLDQLEAAKRHVLATNIDVGIPYDPLAPAG